MTFRTALAAGLLLAAPVVSAQKPVDRSPLEVGHDVAEATTMLGADLAVAPDGTPRALYHQAYAVRGASPEAMARQYLTENAALLRLASPDLADLEVRAVRTGRAGSTVRFTQTVDGVPVYGPDLVVNIDPQSRVQLVLSPYRADLAVPTTTPALAAEEARALVVEHLGLQGAPRIDETTLMVYPAEDGAHLAWQVRLMADAPHGDWQAFVDAQTGNLLRVADRALYEYGGSNETPARASDDPPSLAPTVQNAGALMRVDGTAMIFVPDPLTSTGSTYGGGYVETNGSISQCLSDPNENPNCDIDTPELTAARVPVTLRDVTFDGTNYHLVGPYAEIREIESPTRGTFEQPSSDWTSTRNPAVFEGANTYYHIDTFMRYINEELGISVMPYQYSGGVRFDPHAFGGIDNSYYSSGDGAVHYGEGCVDDDEDADVIIHELGHGIHDWVTSGGLSQVTGLSEGTGDYFAVSYSRSLGLQEPTDPSYNWVYKWDGHNPCWPGRVTNYGAHWPEGITGAIHTDGQMWSSTLMQIWDDIGGEKTDAVVLEGLAMTNGSTNQSAAAVAVLQAAVNMGYAYSDVVAIYERFAARGYSVTQPPPPTANEPGTEALPGFDLTAAYPNPFQSGASFTLRVDRAQHVSVALYDALGRRVQVLYDGPMGAGERRVLSIASGDLPAGLYVYRAVGEGVSAARTVVLSR